MDQETSDLIVGVVGLVIFLAFCFGVGYLLYLWKNIRFTKAWQPLVSVIGGTVSGDGGGGATSWLSGTYKGKTAGAQMSPNAATGGVNSDSRRRYNAFEVILRDVSGAQDWCVEYHTRCVGVGQTGWHIAAKDEALAKRLRERGVIDLVASLGYPTEDVVGTKGPVLIYTARDGQLRFRENAGPVWLPTPERFREELDTLLLVATINAEVNSA
jgi:hypothetical protein